MLKMKVDNGKVKVHVEGDTFTISAEGIVCVVAVRDTLMKRTGLPKSAVVHMLCSAVISDGPEELEAMLADNNIKSALDDLYKEEK